MAILVRNNLNFTVQEEYRDTQENVLILKGVLNGSAILVGTVYGPNNNDFTVFEFLEGTLERWRDLPVMLGGD